MNGNTNVVSSPPDIKVSPSVVQLSAFTHLVVEGSKREVGQQRLHFPKYVGWGGGRGISVVGYGDLPAVAL